MQRHAAPARLWLTAVPLGLLVGAFLWINELPDRRADATAGKRTWVVRLGVERAASAFAAIVALAATTLAALPLAGLHPAVLLGLVGIGPAVVAARRLHAARGETAQIIPAQGMTLLGFVLTAALMSTGLVIAASG